MSTAPAEEVDSILAMYLPGTIHTVAVPDFDVTVHFVAENDPAGTVTCSVPEQETCASEASWLET